MAGFFTGLFTVGLVLISLFIILLVLMQKGSANAGLGASLGGGAAESALGGATNTILSRWTIYATVAFFVLSFGLYLFFMARSDTASTKASMPVITEQNTPSTLMPGILTDLDMDEPQAQPKPSREVPASSQSDAPKP